MRLAVHILGYNVGRFLPLVLRNAEPFVDRIFLAHAQKPFAYIPDARKRHSNPTTLAEAAFYNMGEKLRVITGD